MKCEKCARFPRLRGGRFCMGCRDRVMAEMERAGYLAAADGANDRVADLVARVKNMKSQRGRSR